ncbi:hypothetical protein EW146_g8884 [Bondarzewia mesenterica]|uniref:Uncharacterized protein n=1 Tax=Bondarzewia mesenterica TaxID=1095465 RepID=A0A4S4LG62_9AGAM|nr:hypothetical protein EW146_g8884 [Bondarzewia mesenterica]
MALSKSPHLEFTVHVLGQESPPVMSGWPEQVVDLVQSFSVPLPTWTSNGAYASICPEFEAVQASLKASSSAKSYLQHSLEDILSTVANLRKQLDCELEWTVDPNPKICYLAQLLQTIIPSCIPDAFLLFALFTHITRL